MKIPFWRPSIAKRVFVALLIACVVVWAAVYALGMFHVLRSNGAFDSEMRSAAESIDTVIRDQSDPKLLAVALMGTKAAVGRMPAYEEGIPTGAVTFQVWNESGIPMTLGRDAHSMPLGSTRDIGFFNAMYKNEEYRVYALNSALGRYRIEVIQSAAGRRHLFNSVMLSYEWLVIPLIIGFPLILIPMWIAGYAGMRPLRELSAELARRKAGDLEQITIPHVYLELEPLLSELNGTLSRFRELLSRERMFLADAAHELRTPIALISFQADILINANDSAEREDAARLLSIGLARASRMVNQLLALARLESSEVETLQVVDIAELIREALASYSGEARKANIDVVYFGPDSCILNLYADALHAVLSNLISNAIRYGREGGCVAIELVVASHNELHLTVRDNGLGVNVSEQDFIFQRFYRSAFAKSSTSGSGLGLAIVSSALRNLSARISIHDGINGQGIGFTVVLPHFPDTRLV